jgi:hypothetical protein
MTAEKTLRLVKRKTLVPRSWISYMVPYWTLLGNGVATVLVVYGVYLIVWHH